MKYPCLIRQNTCKTAVNVVIEQEGLNKYGEKLPTYEWSGYGNYQDGAKTVYTDDKKKVVVTGTVLIPGDICPNLPVISKGKLTVMGVQRNIVTGIKARNPDGTVNYTRLDIR